MKETILSTARKALAIETEAVQTLETYLDPLFAKAVEAIYQTKGKLIVTGIGKSAIIAQKIVATCNSTGTPSIFLHAAEAIHGDLGMLQKEDVVICISKSGNSPEIKVLVPLLKRFDNLLIAITGNMSSFLAQGADIVLNTTVESESCPNNLAPTNSTTAQLVMGDALAVCLMEMRDFKAEDFAVYHPGGALGKKLLLRVKDMLENSLKPMVAPDASIKKVIFEISEKRLGVTAVVENNKVIGIITDGDIRRMLNNRDSFADLTAKDIMTNNPKTTTSEAMVIDAFHLMENSKCCKHTFIRSSKFGGFK
mgnify:CR=1 FL=1